MPFLNANNEVTKISLELTPKITNQIIQSANVGISRFDKLDFVYTGIQNQAADCNLIMTAKYQMSGNKFIISNILLRRSDNNISVSIPNSSVELKQNTALKKINYAYTALNIEQLSRSIVAQYNNLVGLKKVTLINFLNTENNLPSKFANTLADQLESDFISMANISVKRNNTRGIDKTIRYIVSGKYIVQKNKIKVISYLKDPTSGITKGSATAYIYKSFLKENNISVIPDNNSQYEKRLDVLKKTKLKKSNLKIDVWTNKGNNKPIFVKGDTMKINIEANRKCYIRIIDIFADETKILLLDNFEISNYYAGKPYELPWGFKCSSPFGAETIIVMAQTEKFEPIKTVPYGDYKKIEDSLGKIRVFTTKALNQKRKMRAEKYINVVTIDN